MTLADGAKPLGPGPRCAVETFLGGLSPFGKGAVGALLADKSVPHAGIHRAMTATYDRPAPSLWSISNHRRGKCRCNKEK